MKQNIMVSFTLMEWYGNHSFKILHWRTFAPVSLNKKENICDFLQLYTAACIVHKCC
jgi:hypothetical protein